MFAPRPALFALTLNLAHVHALAAWRLDASFTPVAVELNQPTDFILQINNSGDTASPPQALFALRFALIDRFLQLYPGFWQL